MLKKIMAQNSRVFVRAILLKYSQRIKQVSPQFAKKKK